MSYIVCACQHCAGHIEFPDDGVGLVVTCPHCRHKTVLNKPATPIRDYRGPQTAATTGNLHCDESLVSEHEQNTNCASAKNGSDTSRWRPIVQECRDYVPIIEGANRLGAGLLVSANGFIVTNAHVINGLRSLLISLHDGTRAKGAVIHRHNGADLAIIKACIQAQKFFDLPGRLAVGYDAGDEVLAIGHPRGLMFTATRGIVSESRRTTSDGVFVQTDVAINPGNSGGPLLDGRGNLIGINTQMRKDSQGLGFAIPAQHVLDYWEEVNSLYHAGKLSVPSDAQLAQLEQTMSPTEVLESAAELAGLELHKLHDEKENMWQVVTEGGDHFAVFIDEEHFSLLRIIAVLDHAQVRNSALLLRLLSCQRDMVLVRFEFTDENELFLGYRREFEDLDVSETCKALLGMSDAVDLHVTRLEKQLGG